LFREGAGDLLAIQVIDRAKNPERDFRRNTAVSFEQSMHSPDPDTGCFGYLLDRTQALDAEECFIGHPYPSLAVVHTTGSCEGAERIT
jgi:hypothetical protein